MQSGVKTRDCEKGVALIEATLAFLVLVIMLMGIVDIGRLANRYIQISRVAYEGVRYAASIATLDPYNSPNGDATSTVHNQIKLRMDDMIEGYGIDKTDPNATLRTCYTGLAADGPVNCGANVANGTEKMVVVEVGAPFEALFPLLGFVDKVNASASGPYLNAG